jgi:hypothetical protein
LTEAATKLEDLGQTDLRSFADRLLETARV